jgi:hypothetical protein
MHMNIRMSNEDWALFQKSGMIENELFSHPDMSFPEIDTSFIGITSSTCRVTTTFRASRRRRGQRKTSYGASNIIRSRIDDMKSSKGGIDREHLEI